jgi:hypothetical protein
MGKPVFNLVRFNGYWPWMDAVDWTDWYPSMRIFRQEHNFVWETPINRIFDHVQDFIERSRVAA